MHVKSASWPGQERQQQQQQHETEHEAETILWKSNVKGLKQVNHEMR